MKSDNRTDAEKSAAAKALHARQRHYDRLHHRRRLIWLEQTPCMYGDGTKIPEYFRLTLINGSKECLRVINDHAMSTNSVDLNSTDYLAVLDKFEKTGEYDGQHTQGERDGIHSEKS